MLNIPRLSASLPQVYDAPMRFIRVVSTVVVCALLLSGCSLPGKKAGLILTVMNSEPAEIYIAGKKVGEAPLQKNDIKPGTYDVRIVPLDTAKQPYETKLVFNGGVTTRMNWNIGPTVEESSGEVFESKSASGKDKSQLSIVTIPDTAIVRVDGQSRGLSPLSLDVEAGTRDIQVSAPGYFERRVTPTIPKGMLSQITVKLAINRENLAPMATPLPAVPSSPEATGSATSSATTKPTPKPTPKSTTTTPSASSSATAKASPTATPRATPRTSPTPTARPATSSGSVRGTGTTIATPNIEIQETPTGWLRVRELPDSNSTELVKLDSGKKVPYLNESKNGWYKIEYATGKEGWVSGQYSVLNQ